MALASGGVSIIRGNDVRTGVTAVVPHTNNLFQNKVPAAVHVANGFGKFLGSTQIEELGVLESPIVLTNTLSTFAAADAVAAWWLRRPGNEEVVVNPVVGECNDGYLNDIRGQHVQAGVLQAISDAEPGAVEEGCVGAGVGTRCLGWEKVAWAATRHESCLRHLAAIRSACSCKPISMVC
ncbi:MAG: P1 family peptidase [Myxococcales bacterium]